MPNIDYARFHRLVTRCVEVAGEQGAPPVLVEVYNASIAQPLQQYLSASTAVETAQNSVSKEGTEASTALEALDGPYRVARSAAAAVIKTVKLPDTLKVQPTDTDKLNAIARLLAIINEHAGEAWADTLLAGDFGLKGDAAVQEIGEAIQASKALQKAKTDRAKAFDPAWEAYIDFKRLVRDAYGSNSKQYRRIHLRSSAGLPGGDEESPQSSQLN
jgi:hypothetical protein